MLSSDTERPGPLHICLQVVANMFDVLWLSPCLAEQLPEQLSRCLGFAMFGRNQALIAVLPQTMDTEERHNHVARQIHVGDENDPRTFPSRRSDQCTALWNRCKQLAFEIDFCLQ